MTEKEWNTRCRIMGLLDTSLIGRRTIVQDAEHPALGYTSKDGIIHVARDHDFFNRVTEPEVRIMQMGINIHEAMHQVFTDFDETERILREISDYQQKDLFMTIVNLIEDPAIENFADQIVGGPALDALYFTIDRCYDLAIPVSEHAETNPLSTAWYEYMTALVHFGDGGLVKGDFTSQAARRCFDRTIGLVYQAINEPDGKKRDHIAEKIFQTALRILTPINGWNASLCMSDLTNATGKRSTNGNGEGRKAANVSDSSKRSERRNKARKQSMEKEKEKMQDQLKEDAGITDRQEETEDPEEGESLDVKNSPGAAGDEAETKKKASATTQAESGADDASGTVPEETTGQSAGTSEELSKTDTNQNHTGGEDENEEPIPGDKSGEEQRDLASKDMEDPEAEPEAIDPETLAEQLDSLMESYEDTCGKSAGQEIATAMNEAVKEIAANHKQFSDVIPDDMVVEDSAPELYAKYSQRAAVIYEPLIVKLKKIFQDDCSRKMYTQSGMVSLKRASAGRVTSRLFERKRLPSDKADMCLMLLVDCSGSMRGEKTTAAIITATAIAETMAYFRIPTYCMGFHTTSSEVEQLHFIQWNNTLPERETLPYIEGNGGNFDSYSIRYATELLKQRREKHKLMNIISDGLPSAYFSGSEGIRQNTLAIEDARKEKIQVFGTAIGKQNNKDFTKMYGKDFYMNVQDFELLAGQTAEMIKKIVQDW